VAPGDRDVMERRVDGAIPARLALQVPSVELAPQAALVLQDRRENKAPQELPDREDLKADWVRTVPLACRDPRVSRGPQASLELLV
jgi:hypothetical protein